MDVPVRGYISVSASKDVLMKKIYVTLFGVITRNYIGIRVRKIGHVEDVLMYS